MNQNAPVGEELEKVRQLAQEEVRAVREKITHLGKDELDLILTGARSHYAWQDKPVSDDVLRQLYEITKMSATSMNSCPARFVFVTSKEGKARVAKSLKPANVAKVEGAPVTVIIAYDLNFWQKLPKLFPHEDRRHFFEGKTEHIEDTAFRNSTLQGGNFMTAARALGLDIGAMSGFSNEIIDEEFFAGTSVKSNFLVNLGYGDETGLFQRLPRFDFDEVCEFA